MASAIGAHHEKHDVGHDEKTLALRPKDAARMLGIGERLLWSKTNSREIPHVRIGRAVLYPRHLLIEWLEQRVEGRRR